MVGRLTGAQAMVEALKAEAVDVVYGIPGAQENELWDEFKGRAKKVWAELTDDDFMKAEGSVERLYGTIQSRFGDTKDKIKEKLDKLKL